MTLPYSLKARTCFLAFAASVPVEDAYSALQWYRQTGSPTTYLDRFLLLSTLILTDEMEIMLRIRRVAPVKRKTNDGIDKYITIVAIILTKRLCEHSGSHDARKSRR